MQPLLIVPDKRGHYSGNRIGHLLAIDQVLIGLLLGLRAPLVFEGFLLGAQSSPARIATALRRCESLPIRRAWRRSTVVTVVGRASRYCQVSIVGSGWEDGERGLFVASIVRLHQVPVIPFFIHLIDSSLVLITICTFVHSVNSHVWLLSRVERVLLVPSAAGSGSSFVSVLLGSLSSDISSPLSLNW